MNTTNFIATLVISLVVNGNALANGSWIVGVAALHSDGPYQDKQKLVAPLIMYENDRLSLSTLDGASYRIFDISEKRPYKGSLSIVATPRFAPEFGGNSNYDGIDRKHGLDIGITGELTYGSIAFEFRSLSGVTNNLNGFETSTKISYKPASLPLEIGVGVRYRDSELNQYLFGVNQSESNESRAAFLADGELTSFINGMVALPLSESVISYLQIDYEDLGALEESPLVSDSIVSQVTLGVIYQW